MKPGRTESHFSTYLSFCASRVSHGYRVRAQLERVDSRCPSCHGTMSRVTNFRISCPDGFLKNPQNREGARPAAPLCALTLVEYSVQSQFSSVTNMLGKISQPRLFPKCARCFKTDPVQPSCQNSPDKRNACSFVMSLLWRSSSISLLRWSSTVFSSAHRALLRWPSTVVSSAHALLQLLSLVCLSGCDIRPMSVEEDAFSTNSSAIEKGCPSGVPTSSLPPLGRSGNGHLGASQRKMG